MRTGIWLGIALFTLTLIYLVYYLKNYASSLALTLITQSLFHGIVKVGFLACFIFKTPNLCNFVMNSFQHNLVTPINDLGTSCVVSFRPTEPNKIDVIA